jgi:chloramphenicol 3-O-phosphotransferase
MPLANRVLSSLLLGLFMPMASAVDTISTEIMQVGTFHGGEVPNVAGRNWLALMVDGEHAELKTAAPKIKTVFDGIMDNEKDKASYSGKQVEMKGPEPFMLIRRDGLKTGVIKQANISATDNGQTIIFDNAKYTVQHQCQKKSKDEEFQACKVYLVGNGINQWLGNTKENNESDFAETISVSWAGDIDRDGKLDLIIEKSRYNNSDTVLLLSSAANAGKHLLEVAKLSRQGC